MNKDLKCLLGLHKLKVIETREIKDYSTKNEEVVFVTYTLQCENCGKIFFKTLTIG